MSLRALNVGASGMVGHSQQLDVVANNLANISTDGFRRSRANFADLALQSIGRVGVGGAGAPLAVAFGNGSLVASTQSDFRQGPLRETGRPLDVAISGSAFLAVTDGQGNARFTRAGALTVDADGRLVVPSGTGGLPLEPPILIPEDATNISIAADGTVSVTQGAESQPIVVGQLEAVRFVNPEGLVFLGDNLLAEGPNSGEPLNGQFGEDGFGSLAQGFLEGSNVEPVNELVDLISNQTAFQFNAQVVQAANENLRLLAGLNR